MLRWRSVWRKRNERNDGKSKIVMHKVNYE
jgi:hypothetical protein